MADSSQPDREASEFEIDKVVTVGAGGDQVSACPAASDPIFRTIGAYMAPGDPPPVKK